MTVTVTVTVTVAHARSIDTGVRQLRDNACLGPAQPPTRRAHALLMEPHRQGRHRDETNGQAVRRDPLPGRSGPRSNQLGVGLW